MGLFVLLLLDGVLVSLGFFFTHVILTIIGSITILCMGIFVIVALVKQHEQQHWRISKGRLPGPVSGLSVLILWRDILSVLFLLCKIRVLFTINGKYSNPCLSSPPGKAH